MFQAKQDYTIRLCLKKKRKVNAQLFMKFASLRTLLKTILRQCILNIFFLQVFRHTLHSTHEQILPCLFRRQVLANLDFSLSPGKWFSVSFPLYLFPPRFFLSVPLSRLPSLSSPNTLFLNNTTCSISLYGLL